ncbi:hypothetical protein ORV05_29245 [Amycolatopsis cynarae]|uniref:Uncharacterized protein n=1 Tax=Amycolatopsis cynarae TaxID=2995223 RepID=A0ABY7AY87_9PSEU|nr:hypothetical protein [Amycolatopsis sp. HUAS 11-8]WAL64976.1 hypothetical protein ORV05_29245 [Amycolatopsis sp. HUAS 11-8]
MNKVRAMLGGLMLGVLVPLTTPAAMALAEPMPVAAALPPSSAGSSAVRVAMPGSTPRAGLAGPLAQQTTAPPGPRIDPSDNARANAQKAKNKIIVGVIAAVLALIVVWGHSRRAKKKKKQA